MKGGMISPSQVWDYAILSSELAIFGSKPDMTKENWNIIINEIKDLKARKDWLMFVAIAASASILSADDVRIPKGGGLELIRHKKTELQPETPPMPETRKF